VSRATGPVRRRAFGFRTSGLFARRSDNAGDVGLAFLFLFQEGVLVVGCRNHRRVVAEIDDLLVLLDGRLGPGLFDFF